MNHALTKSQNEAGLSLQQDPKVEAAPIAR
jgi:hypothetical protein